VAVRKARAAMRRRFSRAIRKVARLGLAQSLEILVSIILQRAILARHEEEVGRLIRDLPRSDIQPKLDRVVFVPTTNGQKATDTLRQMQPDILILAGAGILKSNIFKALPVFRAAVLEDSS